MRPPGPSGHAPLMMGRQVAASAHEAKRGLPRQPGKPGRRIGFESEESLLGADDHVASVWRILNARDDMSRLAGWLGHRRGGRMRAGSRGGTLGLLRLLDGSRRTGRRLRVLLE